MIAFFAKITDCKFATQINLQSVIIFFKFITFTFNLIF